MSQNELRNYMYGLNLEGGEVGKVPMATPDELLNDPMFMDYTLFVLLADSEVVEVDGMVYVRAKTHCQHTLVLKTEGSGVRFWRDLPVV